MRKLLETKFFRGNKHLSFPPSKILKTVLNEGRTKNKKTRKLMTIYKPLHQRDDSGRLYVSRKERRRGFASIENYVDTSAQGLEDNIKKRKNNNLQRPKTTDSIKVKRQQLRSKNGKKNNCMDISSNKLTDSHSRRPGLGLERET